MIDFNDTAVPTGNQPRIVSDAEREELRAELLARLESVLFTLFPAGKKRRGKFLIGDVLGSPGDSLEVVLEGEKAGLWTDRADNSGGDVYALIGNHFGIDVTRDFPRVLDAAADLLGRQETGIARLPAQVIGEQAYIILRPANVIPGAFIAEFGQGDHDPGRRLLQPENLAHPGLDLLLQPGALVLKKGLPVADLQMGTDAGEHH